MKKAIIISITGALFAACGTKNNSSTSKVKEGEYSTIQKSYMSKTVKADEDFFQFANGGWVAANPVPPSESRWGSFNELDKANKIKLTTILEDAKKAKDVKGSQNQLLGDYFASFTDMETRNKLGIEPIQKELLAIRKLSDKSEIMPLIAFLHGEGISTLFGFGVGQDLKNVDKNIVYFGQGGIGLPNKDYYFDDTKKEIRNAYVEHISAIFDLAGVAKGNADKVKSSVMDFETSLAKSMYAPAQMRSPELTYNKYSLEDFKSSASEVNFKEYLSTLNYPEFDTLIVGNPDYIATLNDVMVSKSLEEWQMYLMWCVLNNYAGSLTSKFETLNFNFYGTVLSGKKEMKAIGDRAIDEITGQSFGELLGKAFVEKHFSIDAKNRVNTMVDNLLAVYGERINNLEWMSNETKKEATNKLNAIGRKLGYPTTWKDYSTLSFSPTTYIMNQKSVARFDIAENIGKLNKPVDKEEWGMPAHMVNAYYHPLLNEIAFPAGIMQPPFFDNQAEDAVNYGSIGMVIGHEFTHGFDDMGSKFAADGSFKNWWTESDRKLFEDKTTILGETFSAYCPIEGHCVNPDLTMGENIADLGGLTMAYYAYTKTDEFKKGEIREGFKPAQRFFIAYAQLWKINYTDAEMKKRIATDPHSPGMYRVNGPLQNCPEFFEAFSIKEGSKMRNKDAKVARIW